jgi:hypothetical protein
MTSFSHGTAVSALAVSSEGDSFAVATKNQISH